MNLFTHTLPNGIRLIHHRIASPVGHCGLIINTGSRDEEAHEHGMAHFIEHVIFKGTQKRKTWHILSRLDDVGGELNAYTSKEETAIYSSFLIQDFDRAVELLHDITFHSGTTYWARRSPSRTFRAKTSLNLLSIITIPTKWCFAWSVT
jgi:predicted Zn-dependent peptidase